MFISLKIMVWDWECLFHCKTEICISHAKIVGRRFWYFNAWKYYTFLVENSILNIAFEFRLCNVWHQHFALRRMWYTVDDESRFILPSIFFTPTKSLCSSTQQKTLQNVQYWMTLLSNCSWQSFSKSFDMYDNLCVMLYLKFYNFVLRAIRNIEWFYPNKLHSNCIIFRHFNKNNDWWSEKNG